MKTDEPESDKPINCPVICNRWVKQQVLILVLQIRNWRALLHIGALQTLREHSPGSSTFLNEITPRPPS